MRHAGFILPVVGILLLASRGSAQEAVAPAGEPFYRLLYEQGFYTEAIILLDSLIAMDTGDSREHTTYLAFCHIARGDRETGDSIFERMLDRDPGYRLDTLLTPPKILEVFRSVQERRTPLRHGPGSLPEVFADPAGEALRTDTADSAPGRVQDSVMHLAAAPTGPQPLVKHSLGVLPGGVGQFYQRRPIQGTLLLVAQCAAAVGCFWAYRTRESYFEGGPGGHGWYGANEAPYRRYTNYARVGIGVMIGSYAIGVIDYFSTMRRERIASPRE